MEFLKTFESFSLGEDLWMIMDENEEMIYGDQIRVRAHDDDGRNTQYADGKTTPPWEHVMIPLENANKDVFKYFSFSSKEYVEWKINQMVNEGVYIGYDHSPKFTSNRWKMMSGSKIVGGVNGKENPYKRFFRAQDNDLAGLKPVKFFMGIQKDEDLDL